jgi:hypothetical protein
MFESLVLGILNRYLGAYVEGINADQLRLAVWQGRTCALRHHCPAIDTSFFCFF